MTKSFLKMEFIGLQTRIISSTDKNIENIKGKIINETKNMLIIHTKNGVKKIPKRIATFEINDAIVKGRRIGYRPEDRIRKIK